MDPEIEIKGGTSEYEAAVIAAVVNHVSGERESRRSRLESDNALPAWVTAVRTRVPDLPRPQDPR